LASLLNWGPAVLLLQLLPRQAQLLLLLLPQVC
jgi:hypothetical protein